MAQGSRQAKSGNRPCMMRSCSWSVGGATVTADSRLPRTSFTACELPYAPADPAPVHLHLYSQRIQADEQQSCPLAQ